MEEKVSNVEEKVNDVEGKVIDVEENARDNEEKFHVVKVEKTGSQLMIVTSCV